MITLLKINKLFIAFSISWLTFSCLDTENSFIKNGDIQKKIEGSIIKIIKERPEVKYITIYFVQSNTDKKYIFITSHKSLNNIESSYYFVKNNITSILVFQTKELEKEYVNYASKKAQKVFNVIDDSSFYENKEIIFEIGKANSLVEISNPNEEILELNNLNQIKFIPPTKK